MSRHIVWHEGKVNKIDREILLNQKGMVLWLTGLSASGKSTIAVDVEKELTMEEKLVFKLDGDNVRHGLNNNLGFSLEDRYENIRRVAEVANLIGDLGIITLASFISPTKKIREMAREIIGKDFYEIYVKADIEDCKKRDKKGLYEKAIKGEIKNFTGISSPYEEPENPDLLLDTTKYSQEQNVKALKDFIYLKSLSNTTEDIKDLAMTAGREIMKIYKKDFQTEYKENNTPLTEADIISNNIIVEHLKNAYPNFSILSEELKDDSLRLENNWCWIIDPLDGTKEFIKKNDEFTVNIALTYKKKPVLGVIYAPAIDDIYYAIKDNGAFFINNFSEGKNEPKKISVSDKVSDLTLVKSRSHSGKEIEDLIEKNKDKITNNKVSGSSLKGCLIAKGDADIYYRFGLTSEWDTCAMQCIVEEAGGIFIQMDKSEMTYNRQNNLNEKGFLIVNNKKNIFV
jgi:3'(2'), 5'-bisphosphate nucleotidase